MSRSIHRRHTVQLSRGFTVVELVTVIVLLGILSVAALPRLFDIADYRERGYFDELKAAVRHAQKSALATGCPVTMNISAAGYSAYWPAGACPGRSTPEPSVQTYLPGFRGGTLSGAPTGDVAVAVAGGATVTFDAEGRASASLTITVGDDGTLQFTIQRSGYVLVN